MFVPSSSPSAQACTAGGQRSCILIDQCRSTQSGLGGTGPGRVRTGRACCAVEVVRPSRGLEEDATGPPAEART